MAVKSGKRKGNSFEWQTARALSVWVTGGADKTQLVPSRGSGGWSGKTAGEEAWRHVGDLAPNGPEGETFRRHFAVECKHRRGIDLWRYWTAAPGENITGWWLKLQQEIERDGGAPAPAPMLVIRSNNRPVMAVLPDALLTRPEDRAAALVAPAFGFAVLPLAHLLTVGPAELYARVQQLARQGQGVRKTSKPKRGARHE